MDCRNRDIHKPSVVHVGDAELAEPPYHGGEGRLGERREGGGRSGTAPVR